MQSVLTPPLEVVGDSSNETARLQQLDWSDRRSVLDRGFLKLAQVRVQQAVLKNRCLLGEASAFDFFLVPRGQGLEESAQANEDQPIELRLWGLRRGVLDELKQTLLWGKVFGTD